ncbi:hypothetical protein ACFWUT_23370 [Streptomyces cyaneofuscatus]|uniref:hypothetical protein n=1 Tax=Streptomyces cyaneofuscatus TaxID=66883 RepID=UPI003660CC98
MCTAREIAELAGIAPGTIRADERAAVADPDGPANRWRGATVTAALAGRQVYRRG